MRVHEDYDPAAYGDRCAEFYDQIYGAPKKQMLSCLVGLAAGGAVLEFGLATGRVALQLARRGLDVTGIEASPAMLRLLHEAGASKTIRIISGDFTKVLVPGGFSLVFCIHSTMLLLPVAVQRACFASAVRHLSPNGLFLLESTALLPSISMPSEVQCTAVQHSYMISTKAGVRRYDFPQYYTSPQVLDQFSVAAGLRLVTRWSDWSAGEFTNTSPFHISIYSRLS